MRCIFSCTHTGISAFLRPYACHRLAGRRLPGALKCPRLCVIFRCRRLFFILMHRRLPGISRRIPGILIHRRRLCLSVLFIQMQAADQFHQLRLAHRRCILNSLLFHDRPQLCDR